MQRHGKRLHHARPQADATQTFEEHLFGAPQAGHARRRRQPVAETPLEIGDVATGLAGAVGHDAHHADKTPGAMLRSGDLDRHAAGRLLFLGKALTNAPDADRPTPHVADGKSVSRSQRVNRR